MPGKQGHPSNAGYRQTRPNSVQPVHRPQTNRPRQRHNRFLRTAILIVLFFLVAAVASAGLMYSRAQEEVQSVLRNNTFYPGVLIDGMSLHGMQPQEALEMLYQQASSGFENWYIELVYGDRHWMITPDMIGVTDSLRNSVMHEINKAFFVGRESDSLMENYETIRQLKLNPYEGYTMATQTLTEDVNRIIREIAETVYVAPENAGWFFDMERKNPIAVSGEQYGYSLNEEALREQIAQMIQTMYSGTIVIEPQQIAPAITADTIAGQITLLAEFSTPINHGSTPERDLNIERGCQAFNGMTIAPGKTVSFNDVVGKRTKKNGFHEALEIVKGSLEMGVGGGICQVSSTLYNAVVQAGLEVVSRTNHSIKVGYLEMGLDATVSDDRIDFVFRNNTDQNIYMVAELRGTGSNKVCLFQIYGRPDPNGYTYAIEVGTPEPDKPIPDPVYVQDSDAQYVTYTDSEHLVEGQVGYTVKRNLITMDRSGNIIAREALPTDTYKPITPKIYVGVTERPL